MSGAPIFVIGVPRSGTTLLRTMLDSHPNIAAGPETPWLCAHQPRSIGALVEYLCGDPHGYVANFGGTRAEVVASARLMVDALLSGYAARRGKGRWAEKTPDNLLHLAFLAELFPDARFIHLRREALDVAMSTSVVAEHRKGISERHEKRLALGPGAEVDNTPLAAALRRTMWERRIEAGLAGRQAITVDYEVLVREPEAAMRRVLEFVGEPFDRAVLDYAASQHDWPAWEWGSADVAHLGKGGGITAERVGRAARELSAVDLDILGPFAGRPAPAPGTGVRLASMEELRSERFTRLMGWLNGVAGPLGLRTFTTWSKVWEYPWLWFGALAGVRWPGSRLVDLGSELSPMPWVAAMLGAHVTMIETDERWIPLWRKLRAALGVKIDWKIVKSEKIPLPDRCADVLTSFSVIEHQPDKGAAVAEAARVLKPGGLFALSFDICEPGMTFPEWNGRALTRREFEDLVWLHPAFGQTERPAWNEADIGPFHAWHRTTAPHHDYIVGAANLRRQ
jgi:protein-tyrosine sulfotransferase